MTVGRANARGVYICLRVNEGLQGGDSWSYVNCVWRYSFNVFILRLSLEFEVMLGGGGVKFSS